MVDESSAVLELDDGFQRLLDPVASLAEMHQALQMPGWSRRLRIVTDWTFALLFRADVTKVSLDTEAALLLREVDADTAGRQRAT
jgi:hypothetical protein